MTATLSTSDVLIALSSVRDEESGTDVVTAGMISGVTVRGGKVGFLLTIASGDETRRAPLRVACERAAGALPGVESVTAVMTAETISVPAPVAPARWNRTPLAHVQRVIAVASGKGGVGKSTTAVSLACALARAGKRIGLLDADIYGPSLPRMLGLTHEGQPRLENGQMLPPARHGVACMSMHFLTGDTAAIMRGPMISKTLNQMLRMTRWGTEAEPLDLLLIDLPPGTGDIHLSLAQSAPLDGAIIVTTPQEVALADARKALIMFEKVGVNILGVIENMAGPVFGEGGGEKLAAEARVPFLGRIPLDAAIREAGDAGWPEPHVVFGTIAKRLAP